jgi:hypothetical protein
MDSGLRAEVKIASPPGCPIAEISGGTGISSHTISKSVSSADHDVVTEEFILDGPNEAAGQRTKPFDGTVEGADLDEVFTYGEKKVYRFSRELGHGCPCEVVEGFHCPPVDVHTRDGALVMAFHAPDMATLQDVILTLREAYPNTDVQRLLRSNDERTDHDLVDRSTLTDRQRHVLETAHDMGYFEHPKGANAGEVAEALGITTSTFTEHLAAAQRKLLSSILAV